MTSVFSELSLSEMLAETKAIAADVQRAFGDLDAQYYRPKNRISLVAGVEREMGSQLARR